MLTSNKQSRHLLWNKLFDQSPIVDLQDGKLVLVSRTLSKEQIQPVLKKELEKYYDKEHPRNVEKRKEISKELDEAIIVYYLEEYRDEFTFDNLQKVLDIKGFFHIPEPEPAHFHLLKKDEHKLDDEASGFKKVKEKYWNDSILDLFRWQDEVSIFEQKKIWHSDKFKCGDRTFMAILKLNGGSENIIEINLFEVFENDRLFYCLKGYNFLEIHS